MEAFKSVECLDESLNGDAEENHWVREINIK
jgi:hypothetical protein